MPIDTWIYYRGEIQYDGVKEVIKVCLRKGTFRVGRKNILSFLVLYEDRVKEHSWSGEVVLKNSTVGSL